MQCPKCRQDLSREESCHSCPSCGGVWFNLDQAKSYFNYQGLKKTQAPVPSSGIIISYSHYLCPTCFTVLSNIRSGQKLSLEQCDRCKGLYFDAGESLQLRSLIASGIGGPEFLAEVREIIEVIAGTYQGPYR